MLSIDLGGRTTKAVHLQRKGDDFVLSRFVLLDAPIYEKIYRQICWEAPQKCLPGA